MAVSFNLTDREWMEITDFKRDWSERFRDSPYRFTTTNAEWIRDAIRAKLEWQKGLRDKRKASITGNRPRG